jgi:hypothetical protein
MARKIEEGHLPMRGTTSPSLFGTVTPTTLKFVLLDRLPGKGRRCSVVWRLSFGSEFHRRIQPHRYVHDAWVLLLSGSAGLRVEGEGERDLRAGDGVVVQLSDSFEMIL